MGTLETRSTALANGGSIGSGSEAIDDSSGVRIGSGGGGSGGELVRSFVELVKTVEAKVEVGMSFGELDTCMSRFRGSESGGGEVESERRVVSNCSKTNSEANVVGDVENGDSKSDSGVEIGNEENGNVAEVEGNGKSMVDNGEEVDGETESNGDPVSGASEEGEEVYEFSVGDFVWGKIKSHPWWPGQICDSSGASEQAAKMKSKAKYLVTYFGDGTFAWCHPSQLKPFEENFVEFSKLSSSRVFVLAVQQALDEISRLVKLKMSCGCMGEEYLSGLNQPVALNAGIKEGVVVPEGRVERILGRLSEPADILAELKNVAQVVSMTIALECSILQSLLSAFYCSKGVYQLPVYLEPLLIPGLEDDRKVVEAPVQWPLQDTPSSPIGINTEKDDQSLLQRSSSSIENRQLHRRKEKSIVDLLEGPDGAQSKTVDGVTAKGSTSEELGLSSIRKKQGSSNKGRAKLSKSAISTDITKDLIVDSESSGKSEETKKDCLSRRREEVEADLTESCDGVAKQNADGKEGTKKALVMVSRRRKRSEYIGLESNDGDAGMEECKVEGIHIDSNVGEAKENSGDSPHSVVWKDEIEKCPSTRERKRSKYLSPPFTRSDTGKRKRNPKPESPYADTTQDMGKEGKKQDIELVSPELSNEVEFGERMTWAAANLKESPQIMKCLSEGILEKLPMEGENNSTDPKTMHAKLCSSGAKTPADGMKMDPESYVNTSAVLSGVRSAAVDPIKKRSSFEIVVDFTSIFRDSIYSDGSNYKLYKKQLGHAKRKKPDSEPGSLVENDQSGGESGKGKNHGMKSVKKQAALAPSSKRKKLNSVIKSLGQDNQIAENLSVRDSQQKNTKKRQDKPTEKQAAEPPISKLVRRKSKHAKIKKDKETEEEASATTIFVTFGPGSSLPTKDDLLKIYSKFGELDEKETEMFYTNFCARVAFVSSSDAEEAYNRSLIDSPFGASNVNFRLHNPSAASKIRELSLIPNSPPAKKRRRKTASKALASKAVVVYQPPAGEPAQIDFIKERLAKVSSMLENKGGKPSRITKSKVASEIKDLLETVSTMAASSS